MVSRRKQPWIVAVSVAAVCLVALVWGTTIWFRPQPNSRGFSERLAGVHASLTADGRIKVEDKNGEVLTVAIQLEPFGWRDEPPHVPKSYLLKATYDQFKSDMKPTSSKEKDPSLLSGKEIQEESGITIGGWDSNQVLTSAVDSFINWSATASEKRVGTMDRVITNSGEDIYWFHASTWRRKFQLIATNTQIEQAAGDSMGRRVTRVHPITEYGRAHLWKYLLSHTEEMKDLADSYFKELVTNEAQRNEATEHAREEKDGKDRAALAGREAELNSAFPRPSPSPQ